MISLAPPPAVGQDQKTPFRFLGNKSIPPFVFLQDGKPAGIVVDLAYALAGKAGLPVIVEAMDWPNAQSEVLDGKAAALLQINPNTQREQIYDFSDPLEDSRFQIFRKASRTDIQSLDSLRGMKVGVERGGFPVQDFGERNEFELVPVPTWRAAFILLNAGQIDAVIVDKWVGEYELAINRFDGIAVVDPPVAQIYSRIAVRKGNKWLLDKINSGINAIRKDGTYQRIVDKWHPQRVVYITEQFEDRLMSYAIVAGAIAIFAISTLFFILSERKKRQLVELRHRASILEERERTADSLRLWKDIFDNIGVGISLYDPTTNTISLANKAFADLHGYRDEGECIGVSPYDLCPPSDNERLHELTNISDNVGHVSDEVYHLRKDGSIFPSRSHGTTVRDSRGKILYRIATTIDITTERELETRFSDIFNSAAFGITVVDPDSATIRFANPAYAALHGRSVDDVVGRSIFDLYRPIELDRIASLKAKADRDGTIDYEAYHLRKDGTVFLAQVHVTNVRNPSGASKYYIGTVRDVTEQRNLRNLWTDVIEHSEFGVAIDEPGEPPILRLCNSAYAGLHSMTIEEMNGMSVYDFYSPRERERAAGFVASADAIGHAVFEADRLRKNGSSFPARVNITSVPEPGGGIRYRIVSVLDISNERSIAAQLRQSQRLEAIGQLCAGVAHDFNNLLQGMISHLELVDDDDVPLATREKVGVAIRLAEQGGSLAQQLLSFGRKQLLLPQEIEVDKFLADFTTLLSRTLGPQIRIALKVAPNLTTLWADPTHLRSALLNVAINARDAMPTGGNLVLEAAYADAMDGMVVFRIADSGTGIAPENLNRVCEPFFSTKGLNGTGLGLSMVHGFAKQSGGDLHIASKLGEGTCVELSLPVRPDQMKAAA